MFSTIAIFHKKIWSNLVISQIWNTNLYSTYVWLHIENQNPAPAPPPLLFPPLKIILFKTHTYIFYFHILTKFC